MSDIACPTFVDCNCPVTPFRNFSAELPDGADFFALAFVRMVPRMGDPDNFFGTTEIVADCNGATQQEANDCAVRRGMEGIADTWREPDGTTLPLFGNSETTCQAECPNGDVNEYTVPAATYVYRTQAGADAIARSVCQTRVDLQLSCPPEVETLAATDVDSENATLNATVNPNGDETFYYFEWGTTAAYGNVTGANVLPSGNADVAVLADLSGLTSGTTYHFRIVATNSDGTSLGADVSFQTVTSVTPLAWWKMEEAGASDRIDVIGGIHLAAQQVNGTVTRGAGKVNFGVEMFGTSVVGTVDALIRNIVATFPYIAADGMDVTFWFNDVTFVNGFCDLIQFNNPTDFVTLELDAGTGLLTLAAGFSGSVSAPWVFGAGWNLIRIFIDPDAGEMGFQINTDPPVTFPYVVAVDGTTTLYTLAISTSNFGLPSNVNVFWDELAIWPRLLTAAEFNNIWNGGSGRTWPF